MGGCSAGAGEHVPNASSYTARKVWPPSERPPSRSQRSCPEEQTEQLPQQLPVRIGQDAVLQQLLGQVDELDDVRQVEAEELRAGEAIKVSVSAGLAVNDSRPLSLDALVARADVALYRAKHDGRNIVRIDDASVAEASSGVRRALRV